MVTVSDGTIVKTHTVTDANVTDIDMDTDQIQGTANPGARVWVWAYSFNDGSGRWVTADFGGNWMADFSVGKDGQPAYNITDITRIDVNEFDDDGDSTSGDLARRLWEVPAWRLPQLTTMSGLPTATQERSHVLTMMAM